jgi:AFG3 family protein
LFREAYVKQKFNIYAKKMSENQNNNRKKIIPKPNNSNYQVWLIAGLLMLIFVVTWFSGKSSVETTSETRFFQMLAKGEVARVVFLQGENTVEFYLKNEVVNKNTNPNDPARPSFSINQGKPHYRFLTLDSKSFKETFEASQKNVKEDEKVSLDVERPSNWDGLLSTWGFFFLMLVGIWFLMRRVTAGGGPGGQIFNIGKSRAALFEGDGKVKITFNDVAGLEEAKEEIEEIVEFLKTPKKFTDLGGKIPKGALLVGPPGTGKTLLAKAVAGEAGVPFFTLSGSDFVEMFVGVGAARVRDLFKQAKEKAPCIIFIDEVDAIGRSRGRGSMPGANDERENTLNSLLVEMDGFGTDSGVIILAATNRPDVLDTALLRPGRFDRQISIDKPDVVGREAIFKVHLKPLKLSNDVDVKKLAAQTPGFAGAEIANVCNEAALIAARRNKKAVDMQDFQDALDRVIGGLEKKNKIISPEEKEIVAYHEAGHAVAGWFLEHADPLVKVSIVPRGVAALGYAQYLPREQYLYRTEQLFDEMCMTLGGRAAEDVVFGKISTGALSDLERITKMAYGMVTIYGMNDKIGNVSYYDSKQSEYTFNKPYSEETSREIDTEVRKLIDSAYQRTKEMLQTKRSELELIAKELLKKEIIFQSDLETLIGKRPFDKETNYQAYTNGNNNGNHTKEKEADKQVPENEESK